MCAYNGEYLNDAMECLGDFFDYAVNDYGALGDEVVDLFCMSRFASMFEKGNPVVVSGWSGVELFWRLDESIGGPGATYPAPVSRMERTPEYWLGWISAYIQWRFDISFDDLFSIVPYDELLNLYHPWHEASEERVAHMVAERARKRVCPTRLASARKAMGISQRELAARSKVSLRSIQMYEQRQKDINHAQAIALHRLARALHTSMDMLIEPMYEAE